jgi:multidrug resistance protein MdtO
MATLAQSVPASPPPLAWFWQFLKEELTPYPGRFEMVSRMVVASTLIMIVIMTFRIPYGWLGAVYALFVSRENPRTTLQAGALAILMSGVGAAYVIVSAYFFINDPALHFLWIIATFLIVFYAFSTMTNYFAVVIFAIQTAIVAPQSWDRHVPAETNVEDTLRVLLAYLMGGAITWLVELAPG